VGTGEAVANEYYAFVSTGVYPLPGKAPQIPGWVDFELEELTVPRGQ
jgi:hypothetical protein